MQTIDRVAQIMQSVAEAPDGLTLVELARRTELAAATCHRLLNGLAGPGLVERNEATRRWSAGPGLLRLAAAIAPADGLGPTVEATLTALRDRWQECFFLAVLIDGQVVCVRSIETSESHRVSVSVPLGRRLALHASASAKAILARMPTAEARALLEGTSPASYTRHTCVDVDEVLIELAETADRGFAICDQEMEVGVLAYAAPAGGGGSEPRRSLGVIGPRARLLSRDRDGMREDLVTAAARLSGVEGQMPRPLATA